MRKRWLFWIGGVCVVVGGLAAPLVGGAEADSSSSARTVKPALKADDPRALAATVDRMLAARWAEAKIHVAPPADDAEFLRRVYLDLVGKIPTVAETCDFLEDTRADKRARLVDTLLESSAYLTRATEIYRGLLLPEADTDAQVRALAPTFEAWLRKRVADNVGYDEIVRQVLTFRLGGRGRGGNAFDPRAEPSPLAFYVAKDGKPENLAAGAARAFLGLRIECAQCHNHPFAHWKREEFWGLAAFFAGVSKRGPADGLGPIREVAGKRELEIPNLANGTSKVVRATLLGTNRESKWGARSSGREVLADWVVSTDNPYFARAAVNRVWARFFGVGIVDPVDDMGEENPPSHPELLDELARQFRLHRYDLKYLIRAITATRAYGLTSAVGRSETVPAQMFAAMPVRSLSPGQLFDSLVQATGFRGNAGPNLALGIGGTRDQFLELFANRDEKPTEGQTTILQALALMNGPLVATATGLESGDTLTAVAEAPFLDTAGRIERLYLAALTRRPRADELETLVAYVDKGGPSGDKSKALADVFWALINSPEFRFNH
jgi:hypothetical protein